MKPMRRGIIDELSIGFDPIRWEQVRDDKEEERHIYELKLWEISLVTFGANRDARIMSVHAMVEQLPPEVQSLVRPMLTQLKAHPAGTAVPEAVSTLAALVAIDEIHEGKTLSAKNKKLVKNAVTALKALLDAAGGGNDEDNLAPTDTYFGSHDLDLMELDLQQGMGQ